MKKRELLDAAERVFYRTGDLGLTVRRLAAEADTTSQTIYTYFGSRDAVVEGMYERALAELDALLGPMGAAAGNSHPNGERPPYSELLAGYRRYCLQRPAHFKMLLTAKGPEGTDPARMHSLRDRLVDIVGRALQTAGGNDMTAADVRLAVSVINGFIQSELNGFFETDDADKNFGLLLHYLANTFQGQAAPSRQ